MRILRPARRCTTFALAALALALYAAPACADPLRDREERRIKAEAAFEAILCGPPAIRRRAYCLPPDDPKFGWDVMSDGMQRVYRAAERAYVKARWP